MSYSILHTPCEQVRLSILLRLLRVLALLILLPLAMAGCGEGAAGQGRARVDPPAETAPCINPTVALPADLDAWPPQQVGDARSQHAGLPDGYDLVGESDHLRLYFDQAASTLIVEDKRNGWLWHSSPADLEDARVSSAWRSRIASPILVGYTDADRGRAKVAKPEDMQVACAPVAGGVRATYRFPQEGFELDVVYAVRDDFLEVTIPEAAIVERSDQNTLISLDVLAFFGATHDGEEGYIVFPDGCGAIMRYTSPHPEAVQEISLSVYGEDQILTGSREVFQEPVLMPIFGLVAARPGGQQDAGDPASSSRTGGTGSAVRPKAAFVAVIAQGDFDARLAVGRSGKTIPYNHAWASFVYRRQGEFSLTGGQPAWLYEPDLAGGDRQIRYYFLTEENASYVGIAARYRDFLIQERGARQGNPLPTRHPPPATHVWSPAPTTLQGEPLVRLFFYMGTERKMWFLRELIQMTTFAQAREIMADLESAGVSRADVVLVNWNRGGVAGRYPQRLPVERRLGGADELRALASDVAARGQRLFLHDDYLIALPGGKGVFPFSDAIRGVDGLPEGEGGTTFLNPQVSLRKFAVRDIPRMADLGASGLWLENFAALAVPDTNDRYPLSREGFAASWMQIAGLARAQLGALAMAGGNSYAIPYADVLDFVSMDSTHYYLFDETVPLYPIVAHGLVSFSGPPYNLLNDGQRTFLRQVEYGAVPAFVLTQDSSALLYRTTANSLYSTQYDFWRAEMVRQYQAMERLAPLAGQFIVDHARLAEGVYQTTYEDGTRVVVNYNERSYTAGAMVVPPIDFVVEGGG